MTNIYDKRRLWKWAFLLVSLIFVSIFLYISTELVDDLSKQERERMEIWANATKQLAAAPVFMPTDSLGAEMAFAMSGNDFDFLLDIIEGNRNIPVLLIDNNDNILQYRNFRLPEELDSLAPYDLSEKNRVFLENKLAALKQTKNHIVINIDASTQQHLYYEDSTLLKRISYFPNIQLAVMVIFVLIVYFAVMSTKKAEQNKVWVGLSKETAHQLGTPISSLMAWVEMLDASGVDKEIVDDMNKDVKRLSMIADRFSKIGSKPEMELAYICEAVTKGLEYMRARISSNVELNIHLPENDCGVRLCLPLFEWVMENLAKNAVDAMRGCGHLDVTVGYDHQKAYIEVADSGKGLSKKNFKNVFNPGFTTKKRGWGLGLTLAKRIIEEYHGGKIFVKSSEINVGTVFRIELPIITNE